MAHIFRFFGKKSELAEGGHWNVEPHEIEHAHKVLKIRPGHQVEVMDGKGNVISGAVVEISRDRFLVKPESEEFFPRDSVRKAIAIGALKPGDLDEILPALIELSASEIHVFQQEETGKYRTSEKTQERWLRIGHAAVKQSKSAWMPKIVTHATLEGCLAELVDVDVKLVFDAEGESTFLQAVLGAKATSIAAIVGGERGLNQRELKQCADHGFKTVKLGNLILRARTAAIAVATLILETTSSLR